MNLKKAAFELAIELPLIGIMLLILGGDVSMEILTFSLSTDGIIYASQVPETFYELFLPGLAILIIFVLLTSIFELVYHTYTNTLG